MKQRVQRLVRSYVDRNHEVGFGRYSFGAVSEYEPTNPPLDKTSALLYFGSPEKHQERKIRRQDFDDSLCCKNRYLSAETPEYHSPTQPATHLHVNRVQAVDLRLEDVPLLLVLLPLSLGLVDFFLKRTKIRYQRARAKAESLLLDSHSLSCWQKKRRRRAEQWYQREQKKLIPMGDIATPATSADKDDNKKRLRCWYTRYKQPNNILPLPERFPSVAVSYACSSRYPAA